MIIAAGRLFTGDAVLEPGWVATEGVRVSSVGPGRPPRPPDEVHDEGILVPGFVDVHAHGGGGASFTTGSPDDAARVLQTHRRHGTTTTVASLVTDSIDRLEQHVRALAPLVAAGELAGLHLEGPWISPRYAGAHDRALLTAPTSQDVDRLVGSADGALRMVTLAPELPGAVDAVRQLASLGVVVAVGHTGGTYDVVRAGLAAGANVGTHLFNAMRPLHHREPGPVMALLGDPDAYVEVVADGVHLHPAVVRHVAAVKPSRFVLVTDAMAGAGAPDGDYSLGTMAVVVRDGVARLATDGSIAGSTLTMSAALRYAVTVAGVPMPDAVRAATATPSAMLGLDGVGSLRTGGYADLVVLDGDLEVTRVMRRGRWLPS